MEKRDEYNQVFQRYHDADTRFEYFILGTTLAILAFSVQNKIVSQNQNIRIILVIAWILFTISFLAGWYRISSNVHFRSMDVDEVRNQTEPPEDWKKLRTQIAKKGNYAFNIRNVSLFFGIIAYAIYHIINFWNM